MVEKSSRFAARLRWISPPLLALALYWGGLTAWFQKDDFVWLNLRNLLVAGKSIGWLLFEPLAQGTIRTLSERIFFTSFYELFGLNPLPYRLAALATFVISLCLLQSAMVKLTGSRAAGYWAAILWTVNAALATPLSWTAVYYELMCAFFFLLDVWLLLRYIETHDNRYYAAQFVTFLLGFGVLELNVVYPAIALIIVLCRARHVAWKFVWMFPISGLYMILHFAVSPLRAAGPYKLYWDWHMLPTLITYVNWSFGTGWLSLVHLNSYALRIALALPLALGLLGFLLWKIRDRQWIVLLFPAWFLIVLAPLLPLREHMSYEYLTVPLIGFAMWAGWAIVSGWASRLWVKAATVLLVAIYICVSIPVGHALTAIFHDRSMRLRDTFYAVEALHQNHPDAMVIFKSVNTEMFNDLIYHHAFALIGIKEVYVVPEDERNIDLHSAAPFAKDLFISPAVERRALGQGRAVVYDLHDGVRDVTADYKASLLARTDDTLPSRVDLGDDLYADQLGPTWYGNEGGYRWMPKRASVTLPGLGRTLVVKGFCPAAAVKDGPVTLQVILNGEMLQTAVVRKPESAFEFSFELPPGPAEKRLLIELELDRTFHAPPDPRELGLAFTSFEIKK